MRVFVINLPGDAHRRAFMERQLAGPGIAYEFVRAVDGHDEAVDHECDDALAEREWGVALNRGEKGCALSHRLIYERMLDEDIPIALVLEDDAVLHPSFLAVAQALAQRSPVEWEWLQFGYPEPGLGFVKARAVSVLRAGFRTASRHAAGIPGFCAGQLVESFRAWWARLDPSKAGVKVPRNTLPHSSAYMITLPGVRKIMPLLRPIRFPVDMVPARAQAMGLAYRIYVPCLVSQDPGFASNTAE
jgi:GR25 family glycosyltransferase involved in LPS biosynthesis